MAIAILFASSEIEPWAKTGGLGDVSSALPRALASQGMEVRILVPGYPAVLDAFPRRKVVATVSDQIGEMPPATVSLASLGRRLDLLMLECPPYFERAGNPYVDAAGNDWSDNALRFGLLSKVAALFSSTQSPLDRAPDILHCNDWQTALAPAYLRFCFDPVARSVITIHNLAFRGLFGRGLLVPLGLPEHAFTFDGVEFHGSLSFLKAGLQCCDWITTVSPTYRQEICTPAHGWGLDGLLRYRDDRLSGILNGINTAEWNPARDSLLPARFSRDRLGGKLDNRRALEAEAGLAAITDSPIIGMVGRLTAQKGVDLVLENVDALIGHGVRIVVLGTGEPRFEAAWRDVALRHPGRVAVRIGFDNRLAHLIEAGADIFLMPSRFEPCGLNQMYSLAYGTPPVVHATGGLADTVVDCTARSLADGTANGFSFGTPSAPALLATTLRAIDTWRDRATWHRLQRNGMAGDFSWTHAARQYGALYGRLASASRG